MIRKTLQNLINNLNKIYNWFSKEELKNTAKRIENFYKEWKSNQKFKFTIFDNPNYDQLVILKDISFYSMCSHHMLPFFGKAHVAYLPDKKICGVSKLARVVIKFASKPQIQEQMTQEIVNFIWKKLKPKFVMVVIEAQHLCMLMRGVKQHNTKMITSALKYKGNTDWKSLKEEFIKLVKNG